MIQCSCGKVIDKVPVWMASVDVNFVCNNCPNRQLKNIAFVSLATEVQATDGVAAVEVDDEVAIEGEHEAQVDADAEPGVDPA